MFDSVSSNRIEKERAHWQSEQLRGKALFTAPPLSFAALLSLLLYPILRYQLYGPNRTLLIVASYIFCLILGYVGSELVGRRGIRLTSKMDAL